MNAIIAIAIKDLRLLIRDRANAFFTFIFPMGLAIFFGFMFSGGGSDSAGMKIALVVEDPGPAAAAFEKDLKADEALEVATIPTRVEAEQLVRKGRVVAAVIVPKGFQESSENLFAGGRMEIEGIVDPSRTAEAGLLTGKLNEIGFRQMANSFSDTKSFSKMLDSGRKAIASSKDLEPATKLLFGTFFGALDGLQSKNALGNAPKPADKPDASSNADTKDKPTRTGGWMPVHVSVTKLSIDTTGQPPSSFAISFPQGIVWGLAGCVGAFAVSLANERSRGTLMRLTTAPLTRSNILLGKALGCFITSVVVQALLLIMARLAFGVEIKDPLMLAVAVLASSFGFVGVMMFMAGMMKSEEAAGGMARAFVLVLAMIGGGSIPLVFMPKIMQTISNISPFKWASEAIQGALWRGFSVTDMALPVGILILIGVVGYAVGAAAFNRQQN